MQEELERAVLDSANAGLSGSASPLSPQSPRSSSPDHVAEMEAEDAKEKEAAVDEQFNDFQRSFRALMRETGESDIRKIVEIFMEREEDNFALYVWCGVCRRVFVVVVCMCVRVRVWAVVAAIALALGGFLQLTSHLALPYLYLALPFPIRCIALRHNYLQRVEHSIQVEEQKLAQVCVPCPPSFVLC